MQIKSDHLNETYLMWDIGGLFTAFEIVRLRIGFRTS